MRDVAVVAPLKKLNLLVSKYTWNEVEKKLSRIFSKKENSAQSEGVILIQCVEDYFYYSLFGQIIADIRVTKNIQTEQYILRNFSVGSYAGVKRLIKSKIFVNRWVDEKWTNLYGSYCDRVAYSNEQGLGLYSDCKLFFKARKIAKSIQSKEELVALKSDNLLIGDLIYDTYLRFKPAPTVDLDDFYLVIVIWKALRNIKIAKQYFSVNTPKVLLQSYSTYIQHGVTARVALDFGVNVYTFGSYQSVVKKLNKDDYSHVISTRRYKTEFDTFEHKEIKRLDAAKALENRLSGKIDLATSYMKESAYKITENKLPNIQGGVVIFLHDFYDSPHIYKSMVFADFLEWIEFTINELEKNAVVCYLKPHPNQLPESGLVVKDLCKRYQHIKLLSPKITNKQLASAGMKLGITLYGTVAHELAYMGVPIITCGNNPHSSYDFCFEAKSKKQYSDMLREINTLVFPNIEQVKEEVESFYYMHNLNKSEYEKLLLKYLAELRSICKVLDKYLNDGEYQSILNNIKNNIEYKKIIKIIGNE